MAHDWDGLVLGGLDRPRLLLCNENWNGNPFFNDGTVGDWYSTGVNGTLEAIADDDAYGTNVLHYYDLTLGAVGDSARLIYNTLSISGNNNYGKSFLFSARIKTDVTFLIRLRGSATLLDTYISPTDGEYKRFFIFLPSTTDTADTITTFLYPGDQPDGFDIKIDNIFFTEVTQDLIFRQPNDSKLVFEENLIGSNELWSGKVQRFDRKFRPIFMAEWEYIGAGWEYYRQLAYQSSLIFCIPHKEVNWGFLGIMNGDFERQYSFKRFFGHKGGVEIMGTEFLYELPYNQSGGGLYIDDEEILV
jgi:hypothetical protein